MKNINPIAKFEKVSFEQFKKDWLKTFVDERNNIYSDDIINEDEIKKIYDNIKLPKRSTSGSAGHDFFMPISMILNPRETAKIPTGIRCDILEDWVLQCYPRSSLGFKYGGMLSNTVAIIDSDYYYSDNEGHIFIKVLNNGDMPFTLEKGKGFCQGIFVQYGVAVDNDIDTKRNGGIGSTDNN